MENKFASHLWAFLFIDCFISIILTLESHVAFVYLSVTKINKFPYAGADPGFPEGRTPIVRKAKFTPKFPKTLKFKKLVSLLRNYDRGIVPGIVM